jgi:hypothetical protein
MSFRLKAKDIRCKMTAQVNVSEVLLWYNLLVFSVGLVVVNIPVNHIIAITIKV